MAAMSTKPVAAIIGMGDAYASRADRKDPLQLAAEGTRRALQDAGITKDQVDAVYTGRSPWADKRSQWSNIFISHMQMPVKRTSEITMHGAGLTATLAVASEMIATGQAEYVLCLQSDATELFVDAIERIAAQPTPEPVATPVWTKLIRPFLWVFAQAAARRARRVSQAFRDEKTRRLIEHRRRKAADVVARAGTAVGRH